MLKEGAIDPSEISKYEQDRQNLYMMSNMEAWERHLKKNPNLNAWAVANPGFPALYMEISIT